MLHSGVLVAGTPAAEARAGAQQSGTRFLSSYKNRSPIIAPLISYYNTGNRIADAQRAAGLQPTCSSVVGLLLTFVFGLQSLYYQMELNKITARYNDVEQGTVVPLAA